MPKTESKVGAKGDDVRVVMAGSTDHLGLVDLQMNGGLMVGSEQRGERSDVLWCMALISELRIEYERQGGIRRLVKKLLQ